MLFGVRIASSFLSLFFLRSAIISSSASIAFSSEKRHSIRRSSVVLVLTGISSEDYSSLPFGILLQFLAALVPLGWISDIPISQTLERVRKRSKRRRRMSLLPAGKEKRRVEKPCS